MYAVFRLRPLRPFVAILSVCRTGTYRHLLQPQVILNSSFQVSEMESMFLFSIHTTRLTRESCLYSRYTTLFLVLYVIVLRKSTDNLEQRFPTGVP